GSSVISADEKINDAAINPIFAIGKSYDLARKSKKGKLAGMYDGSEIDQGFIASYIIGKEDCEKIPSKNVFRRVTKTGKERKDLNIVLILLEGWNKKCEDPICESIKITPFFDQLSEKSINFTNCYATGARSNKGIESVICSVPCQFGISALKRIEGRKPFFSIPSILRKRGYSTSFTYGGDMEFDNMKGFLKINGIDRFIGKSEIAPKESSSKWGAFDEDTLLKAAEEMETFSEPFFSFIYLLSSHEPFDLPEKFHKKIQGETTREKFLNSLNYSDHSLKTFFDEVSKKELYKNTIFVLISDHGRSTHANVPMDRNKFHIPFIIFSENEDVKAFSSSIDDVCTQIDVLPTVMGLLGGEYENASWGRNILNRNEPQFAFMTDGDKVGLLHNGILLLKSHSREPRYYDVGNNLVTEQQEQDEKNYMKTILANILHFSSLYLNKEVHGQ
ncbi:MAG: LTA synthase family protein, partial [Candidatus Delongbacteria bacterium]